MYENYLQIRSLPLCQIPFLRLNGLFCTARAGFYTPKIRSKRRVVAIFAMEFHNKC